ncbi:biosynthetic arginine decarboxylase [Gallaecimonas kandeliae]|uniref:biosynthetic arginine decarboxylase n=1 Tax=Gallaecimonas kandeliae TaxID=3029055 RepID=UPI00264780C5|nr:biosynthetic arginine decarboxylase [Gallaecimonas kandeliae]WKE65602.1 biosynthetic arginine decarboxylase [Gallaecimonas kandeliae]
MSNWTLDKARNLYGVAHWSDGYFDIDNKGELVAFPDRNRNRAGVRLSDLVQDLKDQGLSLPVLVRFNDILTDRVKRLTSAFAKAVDNFEYSGTYHAVYPIKVNQQKSVVEGLLAASPHVGLEAGSKPELMAILGVATRPITMVCNGYKDSEFLRLALIGRRLGHKVYVVVEKLSELKKLLNESKDMGIDPLVGVRVRLNSVGKGKWQNTGGEKGKFGLAAHQVLEAVEMLREAGKLDCLKLVHFHIGSQVANIQDIQGALKECARYYAELRELGVPLDVVDVGGGLGVDYEGSRSRGNCSMNYTVDEYAAKVVHALKEICVARELPEPDVITESGRAMTAHHAVLVTNVIDVERAPGERQFEEPAEDAPAVLRDLWRTLDLINDEPPLENYHDAVYFLSEAHSMYTHGLLKIQEWALAEQMYFAICRGVREQLNPRSRAHRPVLDELNEKLADKLFCNFSLFQSMPDVWGIEQLFPIMPVSRLDEAPSARAVIQDITCDSDGQINQYVDAEGIESSLPLTGYQPGDDYHIGIFMVGAYQEILGDLHNLFGDTDSVHVQLTKDGYRFDAAQKGDTVADVLRYVSFDPKGLIQGYRRQLAAANLSDSERQQYGAELEAGIHGYTYLED